LLPRDIEAACGNQQENRKDSRGRGTHAVREGNRYAALSHVLSRCHVTTQARGGYSPSRRFW
jgi:hypothetical protein